MQIGETLRAARLARGLSYQDVFEETRIRRVYLQALENEDWERLPSAAHARIFLRQYAEFLGLEAAPLLAALTGETPPPAEPASAPAAAPDEPVEQKQPALPEESVQPDLSADPQDWPPYRRILAEIGDELRQRRELLGLSLDEVAQHTRLDRFYLQALEKGDLESLASPVQMRGMLQQYADFIELDSDAVLLRFAEALQAWRDMRFSGQESRADGWRWRIPRFVRRLFSPDLLIVAFILLVLGGLLAWWIGSLNRIQAQQQAPTPPSISDVLLAEPTQMSTATPSPTPALTEAVAPPQPVAASDTPTPEAPLTQAATGSVQVTIAVKHRVWLRVLVDGKEVLRERAVAGAAYAFGGEQRIEVQTSDASSIQIYYQGRDLGVLGPPDSLLTLVFDGETAMTPTATVSPTPTASATPTITPTPTRTPRPSATPSP